LKNSAGYGIVCAKIEAKCGEALLNIGGYIWTKKEQRKEKSGL
jgi:hypothetical protein